MKDVLKSAALVALVAALTLLCLALSGFAWGLGAALAGAVA